MKPVRQRILDYLREHHVASSLDLSRVLHLTAADVRHHLAYLTRQGTVVISGYRRTNLRGRPPTLYALADHIYRNNLDKLSHLLLTQLSKHAIDSEYQQRLHELAQLMSPNFQGDTQSLARRIYQAIKYLKDLNYDAAWEAHSPSPKLILGHCPFSAIIDQHPEMCMVDSFLLEILIGKPSRQIEKLSITPSGLPHCVFILQDQLFPIPHEPTSYLRGDHVIQSP